MDFPMTITMMDCGATGMIENIFTNNIAPSGGSTSFSSLDSPSTTTSKSRNNTHKEHRRWRKTTPLPPDLKRSDVWVQVEVGRELKIDENLLDLAQQVQQETQDILGRTYMAKKQTARFLLKVFVVNVSDGGCTGTMAAASSNSGKKSTTWLGEAVVGLTWRIFSNAPIAMEPIMVDGGLVVLKQSLEVLDFFDIVNNHGNKCVLETLAPDCAYGIISRLGMATTQFYQPKSSE
jgi:hypothetical protein